MRAKRALAKISYNKNSPISSFLTFQAKIYIAIIFVSAYYNPGAYSHPASFVPESYLIRYFFAPDPAVWTEEGR